MNTIYVCKVSDYQVDGNQIDLPKKVAMEFFNIAKERIDSGENIGMNICHTSDLKTFETIELQPATNLRWSTKLNTFLNNNSDALSYGCLLVFEKLGRTFSVHTIKSDNRKYEVLLEMFDEDEKHMLLSATLRKQEKNELSEDPSKWIYLAALKTKPFMLLAGISGTGKSRIVREFAFKSCPEYLQDKDGTTPGNYCMVEVKPNWHDSTELLGYWSNINKKYMFTKFVKFLVKAKMFPEVPFFVCLDEMNLAPVEQYFAEFLSVLETRRIVKNEDGEDVVKSGVLVDKEYFAKLGTLTSSSGTLGTLDNDRDIYFKLFDVQEQKEMDIVDVDTDSLLKEGLSLPENVFIIGTVNMDDTTHQFSRKVIDRAMTIEMNGGVLADIFKNSSDLTYSDNSMTMDDLRSKYVSATDVLKKCYAVVNNQEISNFIQGIGDDGLPQRLEQINRVLNGTPFTVSYRVMNELTIFLGVLLDKAVQDGITVTFEIFNQYVEKAIDRILLMKILPRVEGDDEMFHISEEERSNFNLPDRSPRANDYDYTKLDWLRDIAPQRNDNPKDEISQKASQEDVGMVPEAQSTYMAVDKLDEMITRLHRQNFTRYWP